MLTQEELMNYLQIVEEDGGSYPQEAIMEVFKYGDIEVLPLKVTLDLVMKLEIMGEGFHPMGAVKKYGESLMTVAIINELGEKGYTDRLKQLFIPIIRRTAEYIAREYVARERDKLSQVMIISVWKTIQDDFETVMLYHGFDYMFQPGFTSDKSIVRREFSKSVISQFPLDKKEEYISDWNTRGYRLTPQEHSSKIKY